MAAMLRWAARDHLFEARAKQILKGTHNPEGLEGVTWHKPLKGAVPVLVFDIVLDRAKRADGRPAPCPICCPRSPKYLNGAFAWFPDEGVYRCIGIECIATLCGADAAYKVRKDFDIAKTLEADYEFAFENIDKAPATKDYLSALSPAAGHVDQLRRELGKSHVRGDLLKLLKQHDGRLVGWDTRRVERFNAAKQEMEERTERVPILYGTLTGVEAWTKGPHLAHDLAVQIGRTSIYCIRDAQQRVLDSRNDRHSLAAFRDMVYAAQRMRQRVLTEVQGVLAFFTEDNFRRIDKYGSDHRNPENFYAAVKHSVFKIGPTVSTAVSLRPDFQVLDDLPRWPWDEQA